MPNPFLGVRIPPELHEALMAKVKATGQSKSDLVVEALKTYLGMADQPDKVAELESRLSILEHRLDSLSHESHTHEVQTD
ncbi:MAG: YlcI/YnfO family protein [Cyanobacteria bacterium J06592_8]